MNNYNAENTADFHWKPKVAEKDELKQESGWHPTVVNEDNPGIRLPNPDATENAVTTCRIPSFNPFDGPFGDEMLMADPGYRYRLMLTVMNSAMTQQREITAEARKVEREVASTEKAEFSTTGGIEIIFNNAVDGCKSVKLCNEDVCLVEFYSTRRDAGKIYAIRIEGKEDYFFSPINKKLEVHDVKRALLSAVPSYRQRKYCINDDAEQIFALLCKSIIHEFMAYSPGWCLGPDSNWIWVQPKNCIHRKLYPAYESAVKCYDSLKDAPLDSLPPLGLLLKASFVNYPIVAYYGGLPDKVLVLQVASRNLGKRSLQALTSSIEFVPGTEKGGKFKKRVANGTGIIAYELLPATTRHNADTVVDFSEAHMLDIAGSDCTLPVIWTAYKLPDRYAYRTVGLSLYLDDKSIENLAALDLVADVKDLSLIVDKAQEFINGRCFGSVEKLLSWGLAILYPSLKRTDRLDFFESLSNWVLNDKSFRTLVIDD